MEDIKKAFNLKATLDQLRPIEALQEKRIMQKFRLDWNYHSNHLEGNTLTYGETKALLLFGVTAQGKPLKDTLEITGHNEAIDWVIDVVKKEHPLTENFIRELHSLLLKDSYKESINQEGKVVSRRISAGKYKTNPNHVLTATGETFYFASPEETPAKMHDLLQWYKNKIEEENVNAILIAAEFHYKFIRIHPFDDGNGRTARILMNFILMQFGFPPVIIKTEDKENYFAVLRLADAGNIEAFVTYIAQNLVHSLEIMIAGANGENIEEDDDLDKEIALLEQRLNIHGEKSNIIKSEVKFEFFRIELLEKLYEGFKNSKMSSLYNNLIIRFEFDNEAVPFVNLANGNVNFQREVIEILNLSEVDEIIFLEDYFQNMSKLEVFFVYKTFNNINFTPFDFEQNIKLDFSLTKYSIHTKNIVFEKPYGIKLTDSEIKEIVKIELKRHKEFIEQKIAEKENK